MYFSPAHLRRSAQLDPGIGSRELARKIRELAAIQLFRISLSHTERQGGLGQADTLMTSYKFVLANLYKDPV